MIFGNPRFILFFFLLAQQEFKSAVRRSSEVAIYVFYCLYIVSINPFCTDMSCLYVEVSFIQVFFFN